MSKIVLWAGAGISRWDPTNLPLGYHLKFQILKQLFDPKDPLTSPFFENLNVTESAINNVISDITPEAFFENIRLTLGQNFISEIASFFASVQPNALHYTIAKMLTSILNTHTVYLITTNYDLCFESCFEEIGTNYDVIVPSTNSLPDIDRGGLINLIKPHGSSHLPESIVLTLSQEVQGLSDKFRTYLIGCLEDAKVIFMGYSSSEPDLVPIFLDVKMSKFWITIQDRKSLYINYMHKYLLAYHNGSAKLGFLNGLKALAAIGNFSKYIPKPNIKTSDVRPLPQIKMSRSERRLIVVRTLSGMNLCRDAAKLGEKCLKKTGNESHRIELEKLLEYSYRELNDFETSTNYFKMHVPYTKNRDWEEKEQELHLSILRLDISRAEAICLSLLKEISPNTKLKRKIVEIRFHLGRIYYYKAVIAGKLKKKDREKIESWFLDYGKTGKKEGRFDLLLESQRHIGRLERISGEYAKAINTFNANLNWWRLLGRRQGIINNLRDSAKTLYLMKRTEEAYRLYERAYRELELTGSDNYGKMKILWWLRKLSIENNSPRLAKKWNKCFESHMSDCREFASYWGPMCGLFEATNGLIS